MLVLLCVCVSGGGGSQISITDLTDFSHVYLTGMYITGSVLWPSSIMLQLLLNCLHIVALAEELFALLSF